MPLHWILALLLGIPPLPITFRVSAPASTPAADTLFIAGDHPLLGHGAPRGVALHPIGERLYEATVPLPPGTAIEFNVTRGTWESAEAGESGEAIPSRHYQVSVVDTVRVAVAAWRDRAPGTGPDTLAGSRHEGCGRNRAR